MAEKQIMFQLPPEVASTSIFKFGFYDTGRGIRYRHSFWMAWRYLSINAFLFIAFDVFMKIIFLPPAIVFFVNGKLLMGSLALCLSGFPLNVINLFTECICPSYAEIDSAQRLIRQGGFFTNIVPFKDLRFLKIQKQIKEYRGHPKGTFLYLISRERYMKVAFLRGVEEGYVDAIKDAILILIQSDLSVKEEKEV